MKGRRGATPGSLTPEQRNHLKKLVDARIRERMEARLMASKAARDEYALKRAESHRIRP